MGSLSPCPANIQWDATEARRLVADAGSVLWGVKYRVDIKSNIFRQIGLGYGYL